jgi:hypothetical protein
VIKRLSFGLSVALVVFALVAPTASAARQAPPTDRAFGPASALRQGLGGGASLARYGYRPLHPRAYARAKAAAEAAATHRKPRPSPSPTPVSYPNVSPSFQGTYQSGLTPPDTTGAIGRDRYIELVNTAFAIYGRTGSLISSGSLASLTGITGYALSDPQVIFDVKTQRFYYVAIYFDPFFLSDNGIAIGYSTTAQPTGSASFCQYYLSYGADLPDYPKLGDSGDFLLTGYNLFTFFASQYVGSEVMWLSKPPAGSTCAAGSDFSLGFFGPLHNASGTLTATPVPADLVDDANGTGYVVGNADLTDPASAPGGVADFLTLFQVDTAGTDANGHPVAGISGPQTVAVDPHSIPANAPEMGSTSVLDTLDGRLEHAVAAVDPSRGSGGQIAVWTAHAVFGGAGAEERWYEIDPSTAALFQHGVVSSPSLFVWNGAISPDRANNGTSAAFGGSMAMSVSTSSSTTYPAIQVVWKSGSNAQTGLNLLLQSPGPNVDSSCSPCRWGDYSGATADPAADQLGAAGRVWLSNQWNVASSSSSGTDWRTWIFSVQPA